MDDHQIFYDQEIQVALELVDDVLNHPEKTDYHIYCAQAHDGRLAGYICFGPIPLTEYAWDLYWIAVDKNTAKKGVASRLLHDMEDFIIGSGGKYVYIDTSSSSNYEPARSFYQKNGYHVKIVLEHFYRPNDHKVLFLKEL